MGTIAGLSALALAFWFVMFSPWTAPHVNFWAVMFAATGTLASSALFLGRGKHGGRYKFRPSYIVIGAFSAAVLYAIFYAGNIAARTILDFSGGQIENIYSTRAQASPLVIGLLLFFWVAPAEEIFWRGFIQHRLAPFFSKPSPISPEFAAYFLTAVIYAIVHIWGFNLMLFGASLVCGLFWGAMYLYFKNVWPGLISHAIWDVAIFVIWPVGAG